MLFQSQVYVLAFLPLTVALYYALAGSAAARQWVLIAASLVFYGWWDPRFIILVVSQITVTWLLALAYERSGARAWLVAGVVLNLASLGTFKYLDFLLASFETASGLAFPRAHLILPIGISFFSFQLISYLVDRMRGDAPLYPFRPFALFVLVFPHVIAGPIVRHNELVPQFAENPLRDGMWARIGAGLVIFTVGFGKKVLLADRLAPTRRSAFHASRAARARLRRSLDRRARVFVPALSRLLRLHRDGDRLGAAVRPRAAGEFPPAVSRDRPARFLAALAHLAVEFSARLSLHPARRQPRRRRALCARDTIVTMGLCGLWHGAGWTYVAWGLWHGIGLIVCRAWQQLGRPMPAFAGWALTMLFVLVGWVVFRAHGFASVGSILGSLAGLNGFGGALAEAKLIAVAALASALIPSAHEMKDRLLRPMPVVAVVTALLAAFCVFEVGKGAPVNFIYFQF